MKMIAFALLMALSFAACADGEPGKFDYYVLTLSWSPEHCAEAKRDRLQCGGQRHYGFVVHGLWPQYERGYPDSCSAASGVPEAVVQDMLPLMPSEKLIRHEWEKHGTCSGKKPGDYFGMIRSTVRTIRIPDAFSNPGYPIDTTAAKIRRAFLDSNPGLELAVACKGKYLQEVRLCYDKAMHPRACGRDVRNHCPSSLVIMRPVR